jgi:hypothetical protein
MRHGLSDPDFSRGLFFRTKPHGSWIYQWRVEMQERNKIYDRSSRALLLSDIDRIFGAKIRRVSYVNSHSHDLFAFPWYSEIMEILQDIQEILAAREFDDSVISYFDGTWFTVPPSVLFFIVHFIVRMICSKLIRADLELTDYLDTENRWYDEANERVSNHFWYTRFSKRKISQRGRLL